MANIVGPLGLIQSYLKQGISATEGLRRFRAAGESIRTQRWYAAWGEMSAEMGVRETVMAAPLNRRPTPDERVKVASRNPGGYLYRGAIVAFDRDSGDIQLKAASVRTSSLITYSEAQDALYEQLASNADVYGVSVIGAFVTAVRELVPVGDDVTGEGLI